jgi:hypothetical protein
MNKTIDLRGCDGNMAHPIGLALKAMKFAGEPLEARDALANAYYNSESPRAAMSLIYDLEDKGYEVIT